jgi:hypothetical protein
MNEQGQKTSAICFDNLLRGSIIRSGILKEEGNFYDLKLFTFSSWNFYL